MQRNHFRQVPLHPANDHSNGSPRVFTASRHQATRRDDRATARWPRAEGGARALRGRNILIVEDQAILALDLALTVGGEGAAVRGPVHRLDDALAADLDAVDAAILDVDIRGQEVFALADRLRALRVPIVFHTGRTELARLAADYPEARIVRKPASSPQIVRALAQVIACGLATPARAAS